MNIQPLSRASTHPLPLSDAKRSPSSSSRLIIRNKTLTINGGNGSEGLESDDYQISMPDNVPFDELNLCPQYDNICQLIYILLSEPTESLTSLAISFFINILIIASCITFLLESHKNFKFPKVGEKEDDTLPLFADFEVIAISIFTVEYGLRIICAHSMPYSTLGYKEQSRPSWCCQWIHKTWCFIKTPFNVIDLLAILPFYIGILDSHSSAITRFSFLRILRLARVFRVFKLGKYTEGIVLYGEVFKKSGQAIYLIFFFSFLTAIVMGSFIYLFEKGDFVAGGCKVWNHATERLVERDCFMRDDITGDTKVESPFYNIFSAMWWVFTTMTTVGYGDIYPTSWMGKIIAILTMHLGVLGLALPISIIGTNFHEIFNHRQSIRAKAKHDCEQRRLSKEMGHGDSAMVEIQCSLDLIMSEVQRVQDLINQHNEQSSVYRISPQPPQQHDSHSLPTVPPMKGSRSIKESIGKAVQRLKVSTTPTSHFEIRSRESSLCNISATSPKSSAKTKYKAKTRGDDESSIISRQLQHDAVSNIVQQDMDFQDAT